MTRYMAMGKKDGMMDHIILEPLRTEFTMDRKESSTHRMVFCMLAPSKMESIMDWANFRIVTSGSMLATLSITSSKVKVE
jgi:hypothetical protein